jgi:hypothetical protein
MRFTPRHVIVASIVASLALASFAFGQSMSGIPDTIPINPNLFAPPPPPIPPPRIEVPKVPQMDAVPAAPRVSQPRRASFDKRVRRCMEEAAAAGLGPNERAAYSRACANR